MKLLAKHRNRMIFRRLLAALIDVPADIFFSVCRGVIVTLRGPANPFMIRGRKKGCQTFACGQIPQLEGLIVTSWYQIISVFWNSNSPDSIGMSDKFTHVSPVRLEKFERVNAADNHIAVLRKSIGCDLSVSQRNFNNAFIFYAQFALWDFLQSFAFIFCARPFKLTFPANTVF